MDMFAHGSRDADATGGAFSLESRCDIHGIAMQVSAIMDCVAKVDPYAEADCPVRRLVGIMDRNLLLYLHGTPNCSVDAVEDDQQRVAARLDDPAAMLINRGVDQALAWCPKPLKDFCIVQADQAAVAHHIGIGDGDQLPPILRSSRGV
jgi:hypothetical protein